MEKIALVGITGLTLRFVYRVIETYEPGFESSLFSWHPTCMILGQFVALESILLFKYIPRSWRVTIHGIIAGMATCLFLAGFYAIYQNKINLQKAHFTSWHGLFGVSTVVLITSQSLFGSLLKYGKMILQAIGVVKLVKTAHRYNGLFTMMMSFTVVLIVTLDWIYLITIVIPSVIYIARSLLVRKITKEKKKLEKDH